MAPLNRLSNATRELLQSVPTLFRTMITQVAEGTNPNVRFNFTEVKVIRGTVPHPPNTDRREVRTSITLQFNGVSGGTIVAHLFQDGTITPSTEMHAENNRRREQDQRLTSEENGFPALRQTATRRQAETRMMARIQAARDNKTMSHMAKQLKKQNAEQEYNLLLRSQEQARAAAAQASKQR